MVAGGGGGCPDSGAIETVLYSRYRDREHAGYNAPYKYRLRHRRNGNAKTGACRNDRWGARATSGKGRLDSLYEIERYQPCKA